MLRINGCPLKAHPSRNALFCIGMCVNMFALFCSTLFCRKYILWVMCLVVWLELVSSHPVLWASLYICMHRGMYAHLEHAAIGPWDMSIVVACDPGNKEHSYAKWSVKKLYSPSHPRWMGGWGSWDLDYRQFPPHCRCQLPSFLLHELLWWWTLGLLWHWIM